MTKEELAAYQVGENLDQLMNLDPRGYGVCRVLYEGSRAFAGEPTTLHCAKGLCEAVKPGDMVLILTGFILRPHLVPETDGIVGAILLARALVAAFGVKPVIVCPEDNVIAVKNCAPYIGLHLYEDMKTLSAMPMAMGVIPFTKDAGQAAEQAEDILSRCLPSAVIATEAPGANLYGHYHNAVGVNCTEIEAKMDVLFEKAKELGVWNMAIGDLGNEIGMGAIAEHIREYVPYTDLGQCQCSCRGGILAKTAAQNLITATVSDWGCYGLIAAIAYLKGDISIMHDEQMEADVLTMAARSGMIDMTGSLLPGIDGFSLPMITTIVRLMRQCVDYALHYENEKWFAVTLEKKYYQSRIG
ncbi:MAG: DUF4392 domain-containing protein [Lachnospiraceae bacterium]|nr:DUF4392 domain-containing protein [Lachnospiraceae bacterium]